MNAEEVWYYARSDGSAVGPLSRSQLHRLWRDRAVGKEVLVWDNRSFDWRPLKKTVIAVFLGAEHEQADLPSAPAASSAGKEGPPAKPLKSDKQARREALERTRAERIKQTRQPSRTTADTPSFPGTAPIPEYPKPVEQKSDPASTDRAGWAARRWAARLFDLCVSAPAGLILVLLALRAWDISLVEQIFPWFDEQPLAVILGSVLAWIPLEALALTLFGTTPGKLLWGVSVSSDRGGRLGPVSALQRSIAVVIRGLFFGIPPITLLSQGWALVTYINQGQTSWDRASGAELQFSPLAGNRVMVALIVTVGAVSLAIDGTVWAALLSIYDGLGELI